MYSLHFRKRIFPLLLVCSCVLLAGSVQAQGITIKRAMGEIKVDGIMDERDWQTAEIAGNFRQYFPADTSLAKSQTEVRVMYDDQFIYLFARMYSEGHRTYVTPSLRRDFRGLANDGISVTFDTFKDRTNAFMFGVNPFGVQREGLIANGGLKQDDLSLNWDNKWYSATTVGEGYWDAEMAIPFKSIRFKEGLSSWFVNFYRVDSQFAERSTWSPIPRNFDLINQGFSRELVWDQPLQKPGPNISLIPYLASRVSKDFEAETPQKQGLDAGLDAKVGLGPALNLDLTINPDFSQVEVDQQVTNLDRFEIYFPERRQFFLENGDLFSDFGLENARPFFSRRIGIAYDSANALYVSNPVYFGARLSGKINNNLRVGFLNAQSAKDPGIGLPSTNYAVLALQQKVFSRSNIALILVNKQAFQDSLAGYLTFSPLRYNRVAGLDYNLASQNNVWSGKIFYHHSFDNSHRDGSYATGARLAYNTLRWNVLTTAQNIGAHFNPDVGFVRRRDLLRLAHTSYQNFYPRRGPLQSHGPGFDFDLIGNSRYGLTDMDLNLLYRARFTSTALLTLGLRQEYVYLFSPFDPTRTNGPRLAAGTHYRANLLVGTFTSNARRKIFYELATRSGEYFNGTRLNLTGRLNYRYQPFGVASLDFSYNRIRLPDPYKDADLLLIGPRFDLTFTRSLFWTNYFQYNTQINNLNINSRLQWRFKPVSDLFLVYTDNYFAESFENHRAFYLGHVKSRAIVLKLTYWLNV